MPGARPPRPLHASMTAGRGWSQGWRPLPEGHHLEEVSPKVSLRPRRALVGLVAVFALLALPAVASAAITPTLTVTPTNTTAGTNPATVGFDAKFAPSPATDGVKDFSFSLPAGSACQRESRRRGLPDLRQLRRPPVRSAAEPLPRASRPIVRSACIWCRRRRPAMPAAWRWWRAEPDRPAAGEPGDVTVRTTAPVGLEHRVLGSAEPGDQRDQRLVDHAADAVELSQPS